MTKREIDKRFNTKKIEGQLTNNCITREMLIDLLNGGDSTLIGAVGELIAWKYLKKQKISVYRFGAIYFPGIHEKQADLSDFLFGYLKFLNNQQIDYLKNIYNYETRRWDFIGHRYRYKSRYGRKRIEQTTFELSKANNKREEKEIRAKEEEVERLLKKFRIEEFYLIEVKARFESSHDFKGLLRGKGKIQTNIPYAKSLGFKPLLIVVEFIDNWRFQVTCEEL